MTDKALLIERERLHVRKLCDEAREAFERDRFYRLEVGRLYYPSIETALKSVPNATWYTDTDGALIFGVH